MPIHWYRDSKKDKQRVSLGGSQVQKPCWPLANHSHRWHFRAATKPPGYSLIQSPCFAADTSEVQAGNRTCPEWQWASNKAEVRHYSPIPPFLPRRKWTQGAPTPCPKHAENRRVVHVFKHHITYRRITVQASPAGPLPTRVCAAHMP